MKESELESKEEELRRLQSEKEELGSKFQLALEMIVDDKAQHGRRKSEMEDLKAENMQREW